MHCGSLNITYSRRLCFFGLLANLECDLIRSTDDTLMYYIDTLTLSVDVFDFDVESGNVGNRRKLFRFDKNGIQGFPDGMTIDEKGHLWVACFGGAQASLSQSKAF